MRIVVTGGDGYLGRALKARLNEKKDITAVFLTIFKSAEPEFTYTDYSVDDLCRHFEGADTVVHLAAVRGGVSITDFSDNERITENVLLAMNAANVRRFVFMSSIAVYSDQDKLPWREDQPCRPISLYGISKLACENLFRLYAVRFKLEGVIFRLAPVYGEFDPNKRMISAFIHQALDRKRIVINSCSAAKRDFIYLQDAVSALEFGISAGIPGVNVYNIGSGERLTNLEIADRINCAFENPVQIEYHEEVPETMPEAYADLSAAEKAGFISSYSMKDALSRIALLEKGAQG